MSKAQLKKATITPLAGKLKEANTVITVLFNPTDYNFERSNTYKATSVPGLTSPLIQFTSGESDRLSLDLFLDDYTDADGPTSMNKKEAKSVNARIAEIFKLLEIDASLHAPPPVRFDWGTMKFSAVIEKISRKVTMFHPDGTPARATLSVSFKEYRTLAEQLVTPRLESADKTKRRVVVGKDRLWSIAAREYDDATEWVRIAEANDLDDPREIEAGDWLLIPPIEDPNEAANRSI
jgi:nucleoid-associated protein YgaU